MERAEILATMSELKLYGMKAAFDEIITTAIKRQHEPQHIVGDLLTAEISEKQARSIKYQAAACQGHRRLSNSTARRSTRHSSMISPAAASSPSSVMSCWSAERALARPIWRSQSP